MNMFLFWVADECKGLTYQEKNKKASDKWKERSYSEKKKFVDSAKVYKELNVKVSELTEEQKRKLIDRHRKKLLEEVLLWADIVKVPTFKNSRFIDNSY